MFHQGKVLVTSSQTGFDIEYLVELAARIQISSVTFEGQINHRESPNSNVYL